MGRFSRIFQIFIAVLAALPEAGCKRREIAGDTHAEAQHLFDSTCAMCHGRTVAAAYRPPRASQPRAISVTPAFQASRTDGDLKKAIREGKGPMPPFAPLFDDSQLTLLVAYIRGFNPKK